MTELELVSDAQAQASLFAKLARVLGQVGEIPAAGHANTGSYSYDYVTEGDLMAAVRDKLAHENVAVLYSDSITGTTENMTTVEVRVTFADGDTGATWTCWAEAQGTDRGDKGANKAKTSAMRYLLMKMFLVPAAGADPEQEHLPRDPGSPVVERRNLSQPLPTTWAQLYADLGNLGDFGWGEWLNEAAQKQYQLPVSELDKTKRAALFQKCVGVMSDLRGNDAPTDPAQREQANLLWEFHLDPRPLIQTAFASRFDGVLLDGPEWALSYEENAEGLPTLEEYMKSDEAGREAERAEPVDEGVPFGEGEPEAEGEAAK